MAKIGLYSDREVFGAGLRQAVLPMHELVSLGLDFHTESGNLFATLAPALLILDAPPERSSEMIRFLRSAEPDLPLIVWERVSSSEPALSALRSGVQGVILDCTTAAEVVACIDTVLHGGIWVPPSIAQAVVSSRSCHLTKRESQLVSLVTQGLSNKEIAGKLGISVGTVKVYFSRLFDKLEVSDRYELAVIGMRQAGTVHVDAVRSSQGANTISQTVFLPRTLADRHGDKYSRQ